MEIEQFTYYIGDQDW